MKMKIEVECTPEEARAFLGLPDVTPLNDAMMARVKEQMEQNLSYLDPEAMAKLWFPIGAQGFETMQKVMTQAMASAMPSNGGASSRRGKKDA